MSTHLLDCIETDLKGALRNRETGKLSTLRLLKSALKYYQIEKKLKTLSDHDVIVIIQKQIKQRHDAIESYRNAKREDLLKKEEAELIVLQSYLPKGLSNEELEALVQSVIQEVGASNKSQIGLVMKTAIAQAGGRADSKSINIVAMKILGGS